MKGNREWFWKCTTTTGTWISLGFHLFHFSLIILSFSFCLLFHYSVSVSVSVFFVVVTANYTGWSFAIGTQSTSSSYGREIGSHECGSCNDHCRHKKISSLVERRSPTNHQQITEERRRGRQGQRNCNWIRRFISIHIIQYNTLAFCWKCHLWYIVGFQIDSFNKISNFFESNFVSTFHFLCIAVNTSLISKL